MRPPDQTGHEVIEHTADLGLRIWAPTLDELFAEAAVALIGVMGDAKSPVERTEDVALDAPDLDALFVDWLSEVLFLFEARDIVPRDVAVTVTERPWTVRARIRGPSARDFRQDGPAVKAVTYHGLEITRRDDRLEARLYLDV